MGGLEGYESLATGTERQIVQDDPEYFKKRYNVAKNQKFPPKIENKNEENKSEFKGKSVKIGGNE